MSKPKGPPFRVEVLEGDGVFFETPRGEGWLLTFEDSMALAIQLMEAALKLKGYPK